MKNSINYVLLVAGTLFSEKRKSLHMTSNDIAKILDVGDSTIRNFENGSKCISPDKFIAYHKTFKTFDYSKLSRLAIGLQIVSKQKDVQFGINTVKDNGDFELARILDSVYDLEISLGKEGIFNKRSIIQNKAFDVMKNHIENFLVSNQKKQTIEKSDNHLDEVIRLLNEEISTYDVDDIIHYIKQRKKKSLLIKNDTIEDWESYNVSKIDEVLGLTNDIKSVVEYEFIKEFEYSYLFNHNFKSYKVFFYNIDYIDVNEVKEKFCKNFVKVFKKRSISDSRINKALSKIEFKKVPKFNSDIQKLLSSKINNNKYSKLENLWMYTMSDNFHINFLSTRLGDENNFFGVSDPHNRVLEKMNQYIEIWEKQ